MEIKTVDIKKLKPFAGNPKKHPKEQIDKIIKSFGEFGWTNPVLVTKDNMIVAGHARIEAARKAKIKKVPVIYLPFDGKKALAYSLTDNKLAELAEWDFTKLANAFTDLDDGSMDLELTGFDLSEIEKLMNWTPKEEEPFDAAAEAGKIKEPKAKRGEIYKLGRHRLMCGDATSKEDVERLMDGKKADMVFTDPPYGKDLDTDYHSITKDWKSEITGHIKGKTYKSVIGDNKEFDPIFLLTEFQGTREIFLFGADYYAKFLPLGGWFVWDKCVTKEGIVSEGAENMIGSIFELCWSKQKHKRMIVRLFHRGFTSVDHSKRIHPTQKPIQLASWFIEKFSKRDNIIVDLFGGSGSTLIACDQLNRQCRMMEIDETYCDVIINRFEQFSGEKAELITNEQSKCKY